MDDPSTAKTFEGNQSECGPPFAQSGTQRSSLTADTAMTVWTTYRLVTWGNASNTL